VGIAVLLILLFTGPKDATPTVRLNTQPALPTPVVQPMVPSVLAPPNPAGATVQEVTPTQPAQGPSAGAGATATKAASSERVTSRGGADSGASSSRRAGRSESGTVAIGAVGGWADVFLGARRLGTTPVVVTLPAGTHTLTVYPFGKGPAQRSRIEVRAGEQLKHKLSLSR